MNAPIEISNHGQAGPLLRAMERRATETAARVLQPGTHVRAAVLILVSFALAVGCGAGSTVERKREGIVEKGRVIDPTAYAWYARAVHLVAQGEIEEARYAYGRVLDVDDQSGAAWAGLARTYCATRPQKARQLFERGLQSAAETAPLHLRRAECALLWGDADLAVESGRIALQSDPWAKGASEALAAGLRLQGKPAEAARVERASELFFGRPSSFRHSPEAEISAALSTGDLRRARQKAAGYVSSGELAALAYSLGRNAMANDQAHFVLDADPDNADAWLILTMLGDAPDETLAEVALATASDLTLCLFARHLHRHAGKHAALQFLEVFRNEAGSSLDRECTPYGHLEAGEN